MKLKKKKILVRLTSLLSLEEKRKVLKICIKQEISCSSFGRQAIQKLLEEEEKEKKKSDKNVKN